MKEIRCVALLRGINVGTAKRIAMADLRKLIENLGCRDVKTLLNSGNVVFTAPARGDHAARIEKAIAAKAGFSSRVTVLSAKEVAAILDENPLAEHAENPSRFLVCVYRHPSAHAKAAALAKPSWAPERLAVGRRAAYAWCVHGISAGKLAMAIDRALGEDVTARNWATFEKLLALAEATPGTA